MMNNQPSEQNMDRAGASPEIRNAELAHAVQQGELPRYVGEAFDVIEATSVQLRPDQGYRAFQLEVAENFTHELDGIYLLSGDLFLQICSMSPGERILQTPEEYRRFAIQLSRQIRNRLMKFYQDVWGEERQE